MLVNIAAPDIICDAASAVMTWIVQDNSRHMSETCVIGVCMADGENTLSVLRQGFQLCPLYFILLGTQHYHTELLR